MKIRMVVGSIALFAGCSSSVPTPAPVCTPPTLVGAACCDGGLCGVGLQCMANVCKAALASSCSASGDCAAGVCTGNKICEILPTCTDSKRNGDETDTDCGGTCPRCGNSSVCAGNADCASLHCRKGKCVAPGWLIGSGGDSKSVGLATVFADELYDPVAIGFNPNASGELWIANRSDDSLTIATGVVGKAPKSIFHYVDAQFHFLEKVSAISFSDDGNFATCGDSRNDYSGQDVANDFMGPVEWPASLAEFEKFGPDASMVHLDMMHDTPNCSGIASAGGTNYFVFNGILGAIDWYDFGKPHEHGGTNHTDGAKKRYKGLGLKRVAAVPSHLALDKKSGWLYIADTGHGRVMRLDTKTGKSAELIELYADEVKMQVLVGAKIEVVLEGLKQPSGLVIFEDFLYISDAKTGIITAISLDGSQTSSLDTQLPAGALAGMAVGPDDRLYFCDRLGPRIVRVDLP